MDFQPLRVQMALQSNAAVITVNISRLELGMGYEVGALGGKHQRDDAYSCKFSNTASHRQSIWRH